MNRFRSTYLILAICCFYLIQLSIIGQTASASAAVTPAPAAEASLINDSAYLPENASVPAGIMELMKSSRSKYLEGSALIKTGDSDSAQEAFDKAVDMVLQSSWDLTSTPVLKGYFQDLIQRIQQDESRYLIVPFEVDEEEEAAILDELDSSDLLPITIDPGLQNAIVADLGKTKYDIPITVNEMVLKSLDLYLNRRRKVFEDGLVRSGRYRPMIEKIFREESIPLDLIYLAQVESMFRPHAVSKAKAKGIWQFGKGTAIRYGLKVTRDVDERSDPEKSTRAAARYLNDLFDMFKDWNLALAAYNWGEGKVKRLIDKTGMNDFWQLVDLKKKLPEETKNHVPLIQASVILGRNAEKYGLPTELDPPLQYTEVSISKPIDLRTAARLLRTSTDELKKLNPSLRGLTTPANYPDFRLKVPADIDPDIQEKLAELPAAKVRIDSKSGCRHKVRSGETLYGIASRYKVKVDDLRRANNYSSKTILRAGVWLKLPFCSEDLPKTVTSPKDDSAKASAKLAGQKSGTNKAKTAKVKASGTKKAGTGKA
ncbi:MAG: transglycosylase SLT domain-containing protein [Acidobacteria bacterium]|nr:transglycosylase SLT domain-containing protein [Acidobacteriota bacterium]